MAQYLLLKVTHATIGPVRFVQPLLVMTIQQNVASKQALVGAIKIVVALQSINTCALLFQNLMELNSMKCKFQQE